MSPLDTYKYPPEVEWEIDQNSIEDHVNLAKTINEDVTITGVIIQHEYGIFGGIDGEILLSFMKNCKKPMLVTLHTVLPKPTPKMKKITEDIIKYAASIVVLTNSSKQIIETLYPKSLGKVFEIAHGIHHVPFSNPNDHKKGLELDDHIILSTFGLLSRGKGIEYVLNALPGVIKKYPKVLYLVLGETHPVVRRLEGEKYRVKLAKLIIKLGLEDYVKFYDQYFSLPDLFEFLKATDIYISTSTNPNQSVSGTLSYALGSGRAVISTEFAQAKEIISPDCGSLIPIKNSPAMTSAILHLLSDEKRLIRMNRIAYKKTRPMLWSNVATKYLDLLERMVVPTLKLDHLKKMTDNFGLFQFAHFSTPDKDFGYTLDDNARALIACSWLIKQSYSTQLETFIKTYLSFIKYCQLQNGSFINYIDKNKSVSLQNKLEDLEESQMRALWAMSEIMSNTSLSQNLRDVAKTMFILKLKHTTKLSHLRSAAFAIKAFALALPFLPGKKEELKNHIKDYAKLLISDLEKNSKGEWIWFEDTLSYNNALLCESLLIAGITLKNKDYIKNAILSLKFLIGVTFSKTYMPIGHSKWYKNGQERSNYDQQPEDPASMILALNAAHSYTNEKQYKKLANICFSWFLGNNSLNTPLYETKNGGCYDGLHPDRVNLNQGAESLVSYLMSCHTIMQLN